ncbi:MAG: DUF971 domain-containing protein [Planctomycetota bacterium]
MIVPRRYEHDDQSLTIEWKDGQTCRYPLRGLRAACPCATCKDLREKELPAAEASGPFKVVQPELPNVQLRSIDVVGRYALSFTWSDGHATGIYPYEYLRELCPPPPPE